MAGHVHTKSTGNARRTAGGKLRQVREPIPPEQRAAAKRTKQHQGARAAMLKRLNAARGVLEQLDIAREYVMSGVAKYDNDPAIAAAVKLLIAVGDQIFTEGTPVTPAAKQRRRAAAQKHREQRRVKRVLLAEGQAAVRRKQTTARTA
ncbi:hypothetical protein C8D87_12113 [Lentzea atacamensis]|uniref:Uncharacterized protein n=1 Tax=Lentzea atacamensis TaxID=531938 RepID=A0ABX9DW31_9PSEU|nr:hypothetical protein [Lentzea atacamensis]RAS57830.1 hypothetical protein C8D87_12113 [Lentzea atacamensis]